MTERLLTVSFLFRHTSEGGKLRLQFESVGRAREHPDAAVLKHSLSSGMFGCSWALEYSTLILFLVLGSIIAILIT